MKYIVHTLNLNRYVSISSVLVYFSYPCTDIEDYTAFQFVLLTFGSGSVFGDQQCYTVPINDDNTLENDEVFFVTLTSTESASLGSNSTQATVTIRHDPADCE